MYNINSNYLERFIKYEGCEVMKKSTIEIMKNGPLIVKNPPALKTRKGLEILPKNESALPDTIKLCRCGHSNEKPFCDGSHFTEEFDDSKDSHWKPGKMQDYEGEKITITDNRRVCAHVGYCLKDLPSVFDKERQPWIITDNGSVEDIIYAIKRCPSGALAYRIDDVDYIEYGATPSIIALKRGPYIVQGGIRLKDKRVPETMDHYTLCSCGQSKNKPFCDGEHRDQRFKDEE